MKKVSYFLSLAMILIGLSGNYSANAQGRGHKYGHDKNNNGQRDGNKDRNDKDDRGKGWDKDDNNSGRDNDRGGNGHWNRGDNGNHYGHRKGHNRWDYGDRRGNDWERRNVKHYYHTHDRSCDHTVIVHNYARPRYIYYRDYDVYYDCQRSVYISYSGRSWTVSATLPIMMRHVNVRSANRFEVDYWDDNLPVYLERRRPGYNRVYIGG